MPRIAEIAIACPLRQTFDYLIESDFADIQVGYRVKIPFGSREVIGFVIAIKETTTQKVKAITHCFEQEPVITHELAQLIQWTSDYYHHPIGDCYQVALPKKIRLGGDNKLKTVSSWSLSKNDLPDKFLGEKQQAIVDLLLQSVNKTLLQTQIYEQLGSCLSTLNRLAELGVITTSESVKGPFINQLPDPFKKLNSEQSHTVKTICDNSDSFDVSLIQGITGSGKTEVYIQLAEKMLAKKRQVLVLIPEIGLTYQIVARFKSHLSAKIVVINSSMNETDRHQAWLLANKGYADIVIGTRSAVFTPLADLGLIIIDEEHDSSYKQRDSLRYHARNVALIRAKQANIPIVLGSATPSLESFYHAQAQRYRLLSMTKRATGAVLPQVKLIDSEGPHASNGLSSILYKAIEAELAKDNQVLLFINKRGYAPVLMCHDCDWQAVCPNCDAKMIVHQGRYQLRCHHCGFNQPLIHTCPDCESSDLGHYGAGTEQIEHSLQMLFPSVPVLRVDRDSIQQLGAFSALVNEIQQGGAKILVGTQMLAKGHDFHDVTLVGVLDADHGLFSADFRAIENLAQLIIQVTGRAGRGEKAGRVFIQTSQIEHPFWKKLLSHNYHAIAQDLLTEREMSAMPPIGSLCVIRARAKEQSLSLAFLTEVAVLLNQANQQGVLVLGPVPAMMEKRAGYFRAQLLLTTQQRKVLHQLLDHTLPAISALKSSRKVKWSIDIDPMDLM
ncbi:MAG: primosomal protein N' [Gammaproteobacteria bacterium]|nr:primosomal protein N' [Gammaproteobacteria bacterium]